MEDGVQFRLVRWTEFPGPNSLHFLIPSMVYLLRSLSVDMATIGIINVWPIKVGQIYICRVIPSEGMMNYERIRYVFTVTAVMKVSFRVSIFLGPTVIAI